MHGVSENLACLDTAECDDDDDVAIGERRDDCLSAPFSFSIGGDGISSIVVDDDTSEDED
eukprot:CAMPEP_0201643088 /NCGR_PEP_ID=MMETSP0493-20130528/27541_1 /ASSEMBLY_ACC=CAM_ASM_000838 /TAXON_ID=420259 /ORGANISM="Thalassiosira gravida, Strain GMp14c1" /LENGTH=59 /DNA_ID=CAMNT_0048117433 /DNA_START=279 /DNA_END=455 /DNA_ORIENTATION=-